MRFVLIFALILIPPLFGCDWYTFENPDDNSCSEGETDCSGTHVEICRDGNWEREENCADSGKICEDGRCVDNVTDGDSPAYQCLADTDCSPGFHCDNRQCLPTVADGDTGDGDLPDGDTTDGDVTDGDATDGDADIRVRCKNACDRIIYCDSREQGGPDQLGDEWLNQCKLDCDTMETIDEQTIDCVLRSTCGNHYGCMEINNCEELCRTYCLSAFGCECPDCGEGEHCNTDNHICIRDAECESDRDCGEDSCAPIGDCVYGDACTNEGEKCRLCWPMTCKDGSCSSGQNYQDCTACNRNTDYDACGEPVCDPFGPCEWDNACSTDGKKCQACDEAQCRDQVCQEPSFVSSCEGGLCERDTDDDSCMTDEGAAGTCAFGVCTADDSQLATWTDPGTSLVWQVHPAPDRMTLTEATSYCTNLSDGPWRVPTISQLRTLIRGCEATACSTLSSCGSCGTTDSCTASGCSSNDCDGCIIGSGPADGCYWPNELRGECFAYWSSKSLDDGNYFYFEIDFEEAEVSNISEPSGLWIRCVK